MNTVERAARGALPTLADFCLVHVVRGARILCVAAVHASRTGQRHARALLRAPGIRRTDLVSTVAQVVRTRRPILRTRVVREPATGNGDIADIQHNLAAQSVLVVPIVADEAVVGALSLGYAESGRSYAARHLAPARRLARKIAQALRGN